MAKFIVATGYNIDIEQTQFRRKWVNVFLNHDITSPPIAIVSLSKEHGKIWADGDIDDRHLTGIPSIAGDQRGLNAEGKSIMTIYSIGICDNGNQDPTIISIAEQISMNI